LYGDLAKNQVFVRFDRFSARLCSYCWWGIIHFLQFGGNPMWTLVHQRLCFFSSNKWLMQMLSTVGLDVEEHEKQWIIHKEDADGSDPYQATVQPIRCLAGNC